MSNNEKILKIVNITLIGLIVLGFIVLFVDFFDFQSIIDPDVPENYTFDNGPFFIPLIIALPNFISQLLDFKINKGFLAIKAIINSAIFFPIFAFMMLLGFDSVICLLLLAFLIAQFVYAIKVKKGIKDSVNVKVEVLSVIGVILSWPLLLLLMSFFLG